MIESRREFGGMDEHDERVQSSLRDESIFLIAPWVETGMNPTATFSYHRAVEEYCRATFLKNPPRHLGGYEEAHLNDHGCSLSR
jgi:hypothetical protein